MKLTEDWLRSKSICPEGIQLAFNEKFEEGTDLIEVIDRCLRLGRVKDAVWLWETAGRTNDVQHAQAGDYPHLIHPGDVICEGDLLVQGHLLVGGTLSVYGDVHVGGTLHVGGIVHISGDVTARGDVRFRAPATLKSLVSAGKVTAARALRVLSFIDTVGPLKVDSHLAASTVRCTKSILVGGAMEVPGSVIFPDGARCLIQLNSN